MCWREVILTSFVGLIREINRYPVKSFAGESLESCAIHSYGLYGDRFCAFLDETKEGWSRFITARTIPNMLAYKANLVDDEIGITSSEGLTYKWNEELLLEIQKLTKRKISLSDYRARHPENSDLMSVDAASVLIITDSSLHKLEQLWGKNLDPNRFRANIVIAVDESAGDETDWIGKRLFIGDVELQVDTFCERCSMITIDPATLQRDSTLLKEVNEQMNLQFGVYASVKQSGHLQVGQQVFLSS